MRLRRGASRLPVTGKGWAICDRSGKQGLASDMVDDVRGGRVLRSEADFTPGFGTNHPQDFPRPRIDDPDPKPIPHARPQPATQTLWERGFTDADVLASIRAGRPLGTPE